MNKKKKKILIITVSLLILIGIGIFAWYTFKGTKSENTISSLNTTNTQNTEITNNTNKRVFDVDDQTKARLLAQQYIDLLSQYDGRIDNSDSETRKICNEINGKINQLNLFHESDYFNPNIIPSAIYTIEDENDKLLLGKNQFVLGSPVEVQYKNINAHELIFPLNYKSGKGNDINYELHFVKTINNELKIIDGFLINGTDLKKLNDEASRDSYYLQKNKDDVKQMGIN